MNNIQTAKKFFNKRAEELNSDKNDMPEWMITEAIEFAKLHVQAEKKAILDILEKRGVHNTIEKNIIINSYPLTNIK